MVGHLAFFRWFIILVVYCASASLTVNLTVGSRAFHNHSKATLSQMVYGTAHRPFVYRTIAPTLIRIAVWATPQVLSEFIKHEFAETDRYRNLTAANGYESGHEIEFVYAILLLFTSLVGIAFILRATLIELIPDYPFVSDLAPPFAILSLSVMISYFIYDYPNLLLFSICVFLVLRNAPILLAIIFPMCCLSKETSVLILPLAAAIWWQQIERKSLYLRLSLLGTVWIVISWTVRWIFRDNPGATVDWHFADHNIPLLFSPSAWLRFDAFFLPTGTNLLLLAVVFGLTWIGWARADKRLRIAFSILTISIIGMVTFGAFWDELRVYYELVPTTFAMMVLGLIRMYESQRSGGAPSTSGGV